jgi:hypothetical protein
MMAKKVMFQISLAELICRQLMVRFYRTLPTAVLNKNYLHVRNCRKGKREGSFAQAKCEETEKKTRKKGHYKKNKRRDAN